LSQTVVILHGALGSAAQMAPVAAAFDAPWQPVLVELPGHGATPLGAVPFTIEGFAAWLGDELLARGLHQPVVFGYSMGGYVALALEVAAPGTFAAVVTLGTKFDWTPEGAARDAGRLDPVRLAAKVPQFAAELAARHGGAGGWERVLPDTAILLRVLGAAPPLTPEALARVRIPVIVSVGENDDTVSVDETQSAASALSGRAVILPGVPHPIERVPTGTIVGLVRWLKDLEGDPLT
jgi:pimeloyl-ACP methyl ester carboxylesterase